MHLGALPPAFAGLDPEDSQEAAACLQPFSLESGDLLMQQGEEDFTMAFVVQGSVSFMDGETRVGGATSRDMIGEVELFGQLPRTATVVASTPTHLLVLAHEQWIELCERGSPAVYNIERLSHRRIADRVRWLAEGVAERSNGSRPAPGTPRKGLIGRLSSLLGARTPSLDASQVLAHSTLFDWADPTVLREIAAHFGVERLGAGSVPCRQGEVGEQAWLVVDGQVDAVVRVGGSAETIAELGPGQAFGDGTLAQHAPHIASFVCKTDVVALTISRDRYSDLFATNDAAGSVFRQAMLRNLIYQLLSAQQRFVELDRSGNEKSEVLLRGTPVSTVWRG